MVDQMAGTWAETRAGMWVGLRAGVKVVRWAAARVDLRDDWLVALMAVYSDHRWAGHWVSTTVALRAERLAEHLVD